MTSTSPAAGTTTFPPTAHPASSSTESSHFEPGRANAAAFAVARMNRRRHGAAELTNMVFLHGRKVACSLWCRRACRTPFFWFLAQHRQLGLHGTAQARPRGPLTGRSWNQDFTVSLSDLEASARSDGRRAHPDKTTGRTMRVSSSAGDPVCEFCDRTSRTKMRPRRRPRSKSASLSSTSLISIMSMGRFAKAVCAR